MFGRAMRAEFAYLSAAYGYGGPAQSVGDIVRSLPEFPNMRTMLGLGGTAGFFSIAIVAAHPFMTGDVFEQSLVARVITQEFIRQYEMKDRISVVEADFMSDSPGNSYDLILSSVTLKVVKKRWDDLFSKVYDALNPGGVFLTYQDGVVTKRTKPVSRINEFFSAELYGLDFAIPLNG